MTTTTSIRSSGAFGNLPSLTGLRFALATGVFLFHLIWINTFGDVPWKDTYSSVLLTVGNATVSGFFVLSGFVLTIGHRPGASTRSFYRRRFWRVYPMHLVAFVLSVGGLSTGLYYWGANLLLLQNWWPDWRLMSSGNPVSWSLSCDLFLYLTFPLLLRFALRIPPDRLWRAAGALLLTVYVCTVSAYLFIPATPLMPDTQPIGLYQYWFLVHLPVVRALEFGLGIVMARILVTDRWPGIRVRWILASFVPLTLLGMVLPNLFSLVALWLASLALLLPAVATADIGGAASFLRSRVMVWLGNMSLSFFLTHALTMFLIVTLLADVDGTVGGIVVAVLCFVASVAVAWVFYVLVERPLMNRFGRGLSRRKRASAPLVASEGS